VKKGTKKSWFWRERRANETFFKALNQEINHIVLEVQIKDFLQLNSNFCYFKEKKNLNFLDHLVKGMFWKQYTSDLLLKNQISCRIPKRNNWAIVARNRWVRFWVENNKSKKIKYLFYTIYEVNNNQRKIKKIKSSLKVRYPTFDLKFLETKWFLQIHFHSNWQKNHQASKIWVWEK
jgi:hypothetical protein